jgi:glycosyltransferase involved in cell wall biosynthesis
MFFMIFDWPNEFGSVLHIGGRANSANGSFATISSHSFGAVFVSFPGLTAMVPAMESSIQAAPQVCVAFPAYNEKATVARSLAAALAAPEPCLRVLRHGKNQGKGAAVRTGIQHATAPVVLVQDADLEYDPAEYPALIAPILSGKADAVFGSRFIGSGAHRVLYFWHAAGNRFLTLLSNMATNLNLTDMEACYKAFRRELIQSVEIEEDRFGFEPEIVAKVARAGARIYEVAISYHGRTYAEGKKIGWRDGVGALRCILK